MADESLLRQLLKTAGLKDDDAARSDRQEFSTGGANPTFPACTVRRRGLSRPRLSPAPQAFQTVDELKLVMGMTPAMFAQIAPALSVDGTSASRIWPPRPAKCLLALNNNDGKFVDAMLARRLHARLMPDDLPTKIPPGIVDPQTPARRPHLCNHVRIDAQRAYFRSAGDDRICRRCRPILFCPGLALITNRASCRLPAGSPAG